MSLAMVGLGETKIVCGFRGKEDIKKRFCALGFVKGEKVKVVGKNKGGMILCVKGVRIAMNCGLASFIFVE